MEDGYLNFTHTLAGDRVESAAASVPMILDTIAPVKKASSGL